MGVAGSGRVGVWSGRKQRHPPSRASPPASGEQGGKVGEGERSKGPQGSFGWTAGPPGEAQAPLASPTSWPEKRSLMGNPGHHSWAGTEDSWAIPGEALSTPG